MLYALNARESAENVIGSLECRYGPDAKHTQEEFSPVYVLKFDQLKLLQPISSHKTYRHDI